MKHFNLEEYIQNPSRKVVTRDGRNARIICTDAKALYPIIALVESPNHVDEIARSYTKDVSFLRVKNMIVPSSLLRKNTKGGLMYGKE